MEEILLVIAIFLVIIFLFIMVIIRYNKHQSNQKFKQSASKVKYACICEQNYAGNSIDGYCEKHNTWWT